MCIYINIYSILNKYALMRKFQINIIRKLYGLRVLEKNRVRASLFVNKNTQVCEIV